MCTDTAEEHAGHTHKDEDCQFPQNVGTTYITKQYIPKKL